MHDRRPRFAAHESQPAYGEPDDRQEGEELEQANQGSHMGAGPGQARPSDQAARSGGAARSTDTIT
jgi:hypothetical protein